MAHSNQRTRARGENWKGIDQLLRNGRRGLPGGLTLARLLAKHRGVRNPRDLPVLTLRQILAWADAHHERTGEWPTRRSGRVRSARAETWDAIQYALHYGRRGLPGRTTLTRVLATHRKRPYPRPVAATRRQILAWVKAHYKRTGRWPTANSGPVRGSRGETWSRMDNALRRRTRGQPAGSSLAKLLGIHFGVRNQKNLPPLTLKQVRAWASAHHKRTGRWPTVKSGAVREAQGETWNAIYDALRVGGRGLPRGAKWVGTPASPRGQLSKTQRPSLTASQILTWAKAHHKRTGRWPMIASGPMRGTRNETWSRVNNALRRGDRGLPGGSSLTRLLVEQCGMRDPRHPPRLTLKQILAWADAHHRRTGGWPTSGSGPVPESPGETWAAINDALLFGFRGLPGGPNLIKRVAMHRNRPIRRFGRRVTKAQILAWSKAHHERTGKWPIGSSGSVHTAPGEKWQTLDNALRYGLRGLPGGSSLPQLLAKHYGVRNRMDPPRLTHKTILAWADAHHQRTGDWPSTSTGKVQAAPGENWSVINVALQQGHRGLPGGSSLVELLSAHRKTHYRRKGLPLKRSQILDWAAAHHELTGKRPTKRSGPVRDIPGETWAAIDASLRVGSRTLPRGSSLAELLNRHYTPAYQGVGQRLTTEKILKWADDFRRRLGRWPTKKSAYVDPSRGEKWSTIDLALREGHRSLAAGSSLRKLLRANR